MTMPGMQHARKLASPARVCSYRHTAYHKQTKNHWARDDPAFLLVMSLLVALAACAYCIA